MINRRSEVNKLPCDRSLSNRGDMCFSVLNMHGILYILVQFYLLHYFVFGLLTCIRVHLRF